MEHQYGRRKDDDLEAGVPAQGEPDQVKPGRKKQPLHWIMTDLFKLARDKGWSWDTFEVKIEEATQKKIPGSTLRFWSYGFSVPKLDEVDAIATTLGYELDLMMKETK